MGTQISTGPSLSSLTSPWKMTIRAPASPPYDRALANKRSVASWTQLSSSAARTCLCSVSRVWRGSHARRL
jgi:hypothetical protein